MNDMTANHKERTFVEQLRQQLAASEDHVDELTAARLRAARRRALDAVSAPQRRIAWLSTGGLATAVVAVMVLVLWQGDDPRPVPVFTQDDWEMLAAGDLQFIEELDFYDWLAEDDANG